MSYFGLDLEKNKDFNYFKIKNFPPISILLKTYNGGTSFTSIMENLPLAEKFVYK